MCIFFGILGIMKALYFLSFMLFVLWSSAQVTPPIQSDIYDFEVGDSLEYTFSNSGGQSGTYWNVIDQKSVNGNVTTYTIKAISSINGIGNFSRDVSSLDIIDTLDGMYVSIINGDSVYTANGETQGQYFNTNWNQWMAVTTSQTSEYIKRLGAIYQYSSSYGDGGFSSGSVTRLIYAHKVSGKVYGSPSYFTVGVKHEERPSVSVFPNPVHESFNINLSDLLETNSMQLHVFDAGGRCIKSVTVNSILNKVNCSDLSDGVFYWHLFSDNNIIGTGKLVVY
jgi:hypothetical protein